MAPEMDALEVGAVVELASRTKAGGTRRLEIVRKTAHRIYYLRLSGPGRRDRGVWRRDTWDQSLRYVAELR